MYFFIYLICYLIFIGAVYNFCKEYLGKFSVNNKIFFIVLYCGEIFLNQFRGWLGLPYISILLNYMFFVIWLCVSFKDHTAKKILSAAIVITVRTLVWNFSCSFLSILFLIGANFISDGRIRILGYNLDIVIGGIAYLTGVVVVLVLKRALATVFENEILGWYSMLSKLLFLIVIIVDIVNWGASNGILVVSNAAGAKYWDIYYNQIFSHIGICLLTALAMCIAFGLIFGMNKFYIEQQKAAQYHSRIEFYKMLNEQYSQMERLRHDMKNHILSIYGLWKGDERDKLGIYLESMMEDGNIGMNEDITGNKAVDALLYQKKKLAAQQAIQWEADINIPKDCSINEFDLCVLFGNILDNAINGCVQCHNKERHFVHITSQKVKKCFLIIARNGTDMKDIKEMKKGIGFLNIEETVKKYNGTTGIKVENNEFEISVLLPIGNGYNMRETV